MFVYAELLFGFVLCLFCFFFVVYEINIELFIDFPVFSNDVRFIFALIYL